MLRGRKVLRFSATAVAYRLQPELEAEHLVIGERSDGDGRTVEVQRSLVKGSDHERSLGVEGYCLVLDGGPTSYRCFERWAVADSVIVIGLTNPGSEDLGVTTMRIEVPDNAAAPTASALLRLIDDGLEADDFTVGHSA
jgi:hypothetical protein